jgi:hypothetical protein
MTNTLEEPIDSWLKKTEILICSKLRMAILNCEVVMLVHEFNHYHEIFFLIGID